MAMSASASAEINVTPLIDVLLVLLIIFMVITPIVPRGLDSSVPQALSASAPALPPIVVRLLGPAPNQPVRYFVAQQETPYAALGPSLRSLFAVRQDRTLFLEADRALSYQQVAAVVSAARRAGAGAIVLSGIPKS
jgi:biopolymer transport protein TolR